MRVGVGGATGRVSRELMKCSDVAQVEKVAFFFFKLCHVLYLRVRVYMCCRVRAMHVELWTTCGRFSTELSR